MANRSKKTSRRLRRKQLRFLKNLRNEQFKTENNLKDEKKVTLKYIKKEFEKDMTSIISKMSSML